MAARGLMSGCSRCFTHLDDDDRFGLLLQALLGSECNRFSFDESNCGETTTSEVDESSMEARRGAGAVYVVFWVFFDFHMFNWIRAPAV